MAAINDETDTHAYCSGSLSSISKNYMQWQSPVKGENDQHFPAIISPM